MTDNSNQSLNISIIEDFDEKEDIIIPDTVWGEIIYIKYILVDIIKNPQNIKRKIFELKRQILFFIKMMQIK